MTRHLSHPSVSDARPDYLAPSRRAFLGALGLLAGASIIPPQLRNSATVRARVCPAVTGKNIRFIVPFSPGGGYDVYARLIEPMYEARLGAEIFIDNVTGAGGVIGAMAVSRTSPDGTTLG